MRQQNDPALGGGVVLIHYVRVFHVNVYKLP